MAQVFVAGVAPIDNRPAGQTDASVIHVMSRSTHAAPDSATRQEAEIGRALLAILWHLVEELRPGAQALPRATLDGSLERELGLDSLARAELLLRIERKFKVKLPEQVLGSAQTPQDLLAAVLAARHLPRIAISAECPPDFGTPAHALPKRAATLAEALQWHVDTHPDRLHIRLEGGEEGQEGGRQISYAILWEKARKVAAALRDLGLDPGQTAGLMLPTTADYFYCFFGILFAGGIPVPIYPPARLSQIEDHFRRHAGILSNAQVAVLITLPEAKVLARLLTAQVTELRHVVSPNALTGFAGSTEPYRASSEDIALLQYTSGSTGNPKGVVLSHANLLANISAMGQAMHVSSSDVFVSWLPLYHDMGLIGAWLGSLYYACPLVAMSPLAFLARPERWLWAIHRHRGTLSASPNFAYDLCMRKIADEDIQGLDLSTWRCAFNGAEPVSPDTMRAFVERFGPYGFRPEAVLPVYGLAENSVGLAFPPPGRGLRVDRLKRDRFMWTRRSVPTSDDDPSALEAVCCGRALPGHEIRVVDAAGHELGEREEGRLEFKGPSATRGYWRRPDQTARLVHDGWLDSGDLAYTAGGEVYITGRSKDIIIRGGRHVFPYELEEAVGKIQGVRKGCVAVFGGHDRVAGTERLIVLAETREAEATARDRLRSLIADTALELLGAPADEIVLGPVHSVLKTSSGKIRRAATRERYELGLRGIAPRAIWWQFVRLAAMDAWPGLRRALNAAGEAAYAAYAWMLLVLLAPLAWTAAVVLARPAWGWRSSGWFARMFLRLARVSIAVQGRENLPGDEPYVVVANHASYLDGLVLVAALPQPLNFIAKRELGGQFFAGTFLRRIGARFVERFDPQHGAEDAGRLIELAKTQQSLAFFPEGTFTRAAGLRPFRLGAFVAAAQADLKVVPVALAGTRTVLRGDDWFPRHGAIRVTIGKPIRPPGYGWHAAIRLRDAARQEILRDCGEPDWAT
ncbi:AMP-binding protein [Trinickia violacea]|nr:AMP-binding protein [Trinickia violacea]